MSDAVADGKESKWQLVALVLVLGLMVALAFRSFSLFHLLVEGFSIHVAYTAWVVGYHTRSWSKSSFLFYLGLGYFFVAGLDVQHLVHYEDMPESDGGRSIQFWILARGVEAFFLASAPWVYNRSDYLRVGLWIGLLSVLGSGLIYLDLFPEAYCTDGGLTDFKKWSEYGIVVLLCFAGWGLYRVKVLSLHSRRYMLWGIVLTILAELVFTLYSTLSGWINVLGHLLKLASFWFVYMAIIQTQLMVPIRFLRELVVEKEKLLALIEKREEERAQEKALSDIVQLALSPKPLSDLLEKAVESLFTVPWLEIQAKGAVFLWNEADQELVLTAHKALHPELLTQCAKIKPGECLCGRAAERKSLVFAHCIDHRHDVSFPGIQPHGHYCVPIMIGDRLLGVFTLYLDHGHERKDSEVQFLEKVSGAMAVLIQQKYTHQKDELSSSVIQSSAEAVIITDAQRRIVHVNPAFVKIMQYSREEVLGKTPAFLNSATLDEDFYRGMVKALETLGEWEGEIQNRRKDGSEIFVFLTIKSIQDGHGKTLFYHAFIRDLTKERVNRHFDATWAMKDPLTGLYTRGRFVSRFEQELIAAKRDGYQLALLVLSLRDYRRIVDTYDHTVGDQVLVAIAKHLKASTRRDEVVGKLIDQDFALMIKVRRDSDLEFVAEKVLELFQLPLVVEEKEIPVKASVGVALFDSDEIDLEQESDAHLRSLVESLIRRANQAMQRAKDSSKDWLLHTPEMGEGDSQSLLFHMALNRSLAHGGEEVQLAFQPLVDLQGPTPGRILGAEALLRWQHPEFQDRSPFEVVKMAEDMGLIVALGEIVFQKACEARKAWADAGYDDLFVSVNLSALQFGDPSLVLNLQQIQVRSGISAEDVKLEITETALAEDENQAVEIMRRLRQIGFQLAIDDFGTGYSALQYLSRFPVQTLKLDRSFVLDIDDAPSGKNLLSGIIDLAKRLDLQLVAEGIEEVHHQAFLQEKGCHIGQGYWFSRPIPQEAFLELLQTTQGVISPTEGD